MEKEEAFGYETWRVWSWGVVGFEYEWYEVCEGLKVKKEVFLAYVSSAKGKMAKTRGEALGMSKGEGMK